MKLTKKQEAEYRKKRHEFLKVNRYCAVWMHLGKMVRATHVHHKKGRREHLLDESTFLPVSRAGDLWIHQNEEKARALGWLE